MEAHLLAYLRHHGAVARGLAETFGFNLDELIGTLIEMGEKDWVEFGRPWGVTVVALTPAGRSAADRRQGERRKDLPVILTREKLVAVLRRDFGWTEEQVARNPRLRAERFWFQPLKAVWYPEYERPKALARGIGSLRKLLRTVAARLRAVPQRPGFN
jgi:hypothetical protein